MSQGLSWLTKNSIREDVKNKLKTWFLIARIQSFFSCKSNLVTIAGLGRWASLSNYWHALKLEDPILRNYGTFWSFYSYFWRHPSENYPQNQSPAHIWLFPNRLHPRCVQGDQGRGRDVFLLDDGGDGHHGEEVPGMEDRDESSPGVGGLPRHLRPLPPHTLCRGQPGLLHPPAPHRDLHHIHGGEGCHPAQEGILPGNAPRKSLLKSRVNNFLAARQLLKLKDWLVGHTFVSNFSRTYSRIAQSHELGTIFTVASRQGNTVRRRLRSQRLSSVTRNVCWGVLTSAAVQLTSMSLMIVSWRSAPQARRLQYSNYWWGKLLEASTNSCWIFFCQF